MEARTHNVFWVSPDGDRYEHLRLVENEDGFVADGLILRRRDEDDVRMRSMPVFVRRRLMAQVEWSAAAAGRRCFATSARGIG